MVGLKVSIFLKFQERLNRLLKYSVRFLLGLLLCGDTTHMYYTIRQQICNTNCVFTGSGMEKIALLKLIIAVQNFCRAIFFESTESNIFDASKENNPQNLNLDYYSKKMFKCWDSNSYLTCQNIFVLPTLQWELLINFKHQPKHKNILQSKVSNLDLLLEKSLPLPLW